tara:strand:- start:671 stop:952 length:282 start_codon:yes stop_codon:yes gene_type:complete
MQPDEPLNVVNNSVMQIAAVHVENCSLLRELCYDMRIGVPDAGNIVVEIEIPAASYVLKPDSLAFHQLEWFVVKERGIVAHHPAMAIQKFGHA